MKIVPTIFEDPATAESAEAAVSIIRCRLPVDSILLLRRKEMESDPWSGHFAFPGGRRDGEDRTIYGTCIRETLEETGIRLEDSTLINELGVTMAGSRARESISVKPFLFELDERPDVLVEVSEIASYHWLDIGQFSKPGHHISAEVIPEYRFPAYPLEDYYLWGFTYGVLCRLLGVRQN